MSSKNEFVQLLETIEKDKGIPRQEILRLIEGAVASALHKHLGRELPVKTEVDPETGEIHAWIVKKVADSVEDPLEQITLKEARVITPESSVGEEIAVKVDTGDFSRIAAQTAKQVILQKLREVENENLFQDFKKKESLIITGSVYRVGRDETVYVSLGKIEALLRKEDQIPVPGGRFAIGQLLKALVRAVEPSARGPQVFLSQAAPDFVKGLLRLEVPEVHDGTVEVVKVVREPGFRCKVLVRSSNPKVDPVGSCVGIKGTRIRPIIAELHGERIDLIAESAKVEELLSLSLAPAKISRVEIEDSERQTAIIHVTQDQASGAIGKDGLNLKLAMELTGWNLTVQVLPAAVPVATPPPVTVPEVEAKSESGETISS